MARILLAEDEENLRKTLKLNLELEGNEVLTAGNGHEALQIFPTARFDLVILDVMMPELDGFAVCQAIRLRDRDTPILFLTARNAGTDRVQGLKLGGDDYLAKPFNLEELLLRVRILTRRRNRYPSDVYERSIGDACNIGPFRVNFKTFEIIGPDEQTRKITQKEVLLLKLLTEQENEVVSREQILEKVWGYDVFPSTRTIDNYIVNFRKYFGDDPREPRYFHSVRGVGYKFTGK
ncbi:MAG: response regulator transcription factor [Flavobacteriales bacterium]|nr:response regulator transcription factor [Flavobacteriales bacterium]MCB9446938.1 response regulator transcription factor [Flavobacteriales bacterium]